LWLGFIKQLVCFGERTLEQVGEISPLAGGKSVILALKQGVKVFRWVGFDELLLRIHAHIILTSMVWVCFFFFCIGILSCIVVGLAQL